MCEKMPKEETAIRHDLGGTVKREAGNVSFSKQVVDKTNMGTAFPGKSKENISSKKK